MDMMSYLGKKVELDCQKMLKDGYKFYISDNGVVLTEKVPKKYLKQVQI